jgi:hypothetical protein
MGGWPRGLSEVRNLSRQIPIGFEIFQYDFQTNNSDLSCNCEQKAFNRENMVNSIDFGTIITNRLAKNRDAKVPSENLASTHIWDFAWSQSMRILPRKVAYKLVAVESVVNVGSSLKKQLNQAKMTLASGLLQKWASLVL